MAGTPKPRPLKSEEQACLDWRTAIARDASFEIYLNLGRPLNKPPNWDGTQEPWKSWQDVCSFLGKWANEPAYNANPHHKRKRWRRRMRIVKYRREVADFCDRWRLKAWWAPPAIVHDHFLRGKNESTWDPTIPPLNMYVFDPAPLVSLPLTVKLPGRTCAQFKHDKARELSRVEITVLQAAHGPVRVIRSHFSPGERAAWEDAVDASCTTLE